MSTLNVTNISDGTNSTSTTNVVKGSAKAWVCFDGTGTVAIRTSYNISSITDYGTGDYGITFTTNMPTADYCALATTVKGGGAPSTSNCGIAGVNDYTGSVSGFGVHSITASGGAVDKAYVMAAAFSS